jgi:hypothetical protein
MQMYLWNDPLTNIAGPGSNPYIQGAGPTGRTSSPSTRTASRTGWSDASGVSTLGNIQAARWARPARLVRDIPGKDRLFTDTAAPGQLRVGQYVGAGGTVRTEPIDCRSVRPAECPGTTGCPAAARTTTSQGLIRSRSTRTAIWGQTLWDTPPGLGSKMTEGS